MAGDMDQGLKRLCQLRAQDLLSFGLPGAELLAALPTDLATEPQLVTDTLFHARYQGDECLIDLEIEAAPTRDMGERLYRYSSRAHGLYGPPVLPVVLWLQRGHGG